MNAAHIHLALVHVPVLFVPLALVLLAGGYWFKKTLLTQVAMGLFVFSSLVSIPAFLTGEPAEERVEELPGVSEHVIEEHEEAAEFAFYVTAALGALALTSLLLKADVPVKRFATPTVLAVGLLASGALLRAAMLGGQIRHSEIRNPAGQIETSSETQEDDDD